MKCRSSQAPSYLKSFTTILALTCFTSLSVVETYPAEANPGASLGATHLSVTPSSTNLALRSRRVVFRLPDRGAPGSREGGAARGGCSPVSASVDPSPGKKLTALMPTTNLGYTTVGFPTLFIYVPTTTATTAEFILQDQNYKEIYKTMMPLKGTNGIVSFTLPDTGVLSPLEVGKQYHWYFTVVCDADEPSANVSVEGWIQRIEPSPGLNSNLLKAKPDERPAVYAEAGIWYEALTALADLRRTRPNDPILAADWTDLLNSVKLDKITAEPLISCCALQ
ncbi:DUF928 domain-containing protein [Neosynechococcus sphagnicola]|uniref:DUF928 domain-containing protein n=1 Tax=Neosynechococcus sphagnicola TaxID=1501145 RepID=UPI00068C6D0A|nr:DUF928 domain-containing protein [Neosynechococcus sphagnicola]